MPLSRFTWGRDAGGDGSVAVAGRAVLASADSELSSLTIGV